MTNMPPSFVSDIAKSPKSRSYQCVSKTKAVDGRDKPGHDACILTEGRSSRRSEIGAPRRSRLVFEGERDAGAEGGHFAVLDFHVHLGDFGDAEIAQGIGGRFDGAAAGILPGLFADTDNIDDAIDAIRIFACHELGPFALDGINQAFRT
jgi:hypothetical protein